MPELPLTDRQVNGLMDQVIEDLRAGRTESAHAAATRVGAARHCDVETVFRLARAEPA